MKRTRQAAAAGIDHAVALTQVNRRLREAAGIVLGFSAIIALLALMSFNVNDPGWSHTGEGTQVHNNVGRAGAWFADVALYNFGYMAYLIPLMLGVGAWVLISEKQPMPVGYRPFAFVRVIGIVLMLVTASGLADLHFSVPEGALPRQTFGGGILGAMTAWRLVSFLNPLGTTLLLLALFIGSLTLAFGTSWIKIIESMGSVVLGVGRQLKSVGGNLNDTRLEKAKIRAARQVREDRLRPALVGDPLLEPMEHVEKRKGLAATLRAARDKALKGSQAAKRAAGSIGGNPLARDNATRFDVLADSLEPEHAPKNAEDAPWRVKPADEFLDSFDSATTESPADSDSSPAKAALERARQAAASVAKTATNAVEGVASEAVATGKTLSTKKKKLAIKQRPPENKQTKLFLDVPDSEMPPLSLLDAPEPQRRGFSEAELENLSRLLEEKLAEFRITVEVVAVQPGPVITRFEMQLAPGIKASRITNLSQDIARSLSLVSVRVVEVIPGKSTIGIEVPNENREVVQLSEMLQSSEYSDKKSVLTLALGKDISGQPVTADLARMPHLLVAGTTGSGKSVAVNAMLISLLYKATANDVRLILIDPKMLELNVYDDIPHLLTPVVTDMKEAANALRWCVAEMERRYTLMAELKVRNVTGFNKKVNDAIDAGTPIVDPLYKAEESLTPTAAPPTLEPMPLIVVVVDEFADMMMQVGKKAEEMIARIAQKARAAGIHLILATQRPSVDVITGLIKANVPTRIAFQVSQKVDSRTILDQGGAESLLGHGDMLYLPPGTAVPIRVHGAFVDDHEVHNVVAHVKQAGEPNYVEEILQEQTAMIPGLSGGGSEEGGEQDALYDQAVAIVTESRKASISYVQRRLKIGYNRAARMVEEMEAAGVVSQVQSNGSREVLAPPPIK